MKICPECKQSVMDEAKFCPECGEIFHPIRFCPACGKGAGDRANFCQACGAGLADPLIARWTEERGEIGKAPVSGKANRSGGKYVFVSYAHKDSKEVLPIIGALQAAGVSLWYDAGIEAGSEWPEYIAEHLLGSCKVILMVSDHFVASKNCKQELTMAEREKKELLSIHLRDDVALTPGLQLQLGNNQALFRSRYASDRAFLDELIHSRFLADCFLPGAKENAPSAGLAPGIHALSEYLWEEGEDGGKIITGVRNRSLSRAVLPSGVVSLGANAFYGCSHLTRLILPKGLATVGDFAFHGCSSLTQMEFSEGLTAIGQAAFGLCSSLSRVELPKGLQSIGPSAFKGCSSLTRLEIPASMTCIGKFAFEGSGLVEVVIPESVTQFATAAFLNCNQLTKIRYGGTKEAWRRVEKSLWWDKNTGKYTVICRDGEIMK